MLWINLAGCKLQRRIKDKIKEIGVFYTFLSSVLFVIKGYFAIRNSRISKRIKKEDSEQLITLDNNKELLVNLSDEGLSREIFHYGKREPIVLEQLLAHFKIHKYHSFIDIGANLGYYTVYLEEFFNKIYCIEPVPHNYNYLVKNIELNNLTKKCFLYNCAVGAEDKEISIVVPGKKNLSRIIRDGESTPQNGGLVHERVGLKRLSSILDYSEIREPIFVKMDIEGYEYEVITSNVDFFLQKRPTLFVEIHDELGAEKIKKLLTTLKRLDYRVLCAVADFIPQEYICRSKKYGTSLDLSILRVNRYFQKLIYDRGQRGVLYENKDIDAIINENFVCSRWLEYVFVPNGLCKTL